MKYLILILLTLCTSCAMLPPEVDKTITFDTNKSNDPHDMYDFILNYYKDSHKKLKYAENRLAARTRNDNYAGLIETIIKWCPEKPGYDRKDLENKIRNKCEAIGGKYNKFWCSDQNGEKPLFFAASASRFRWRTLFGYYDKNDCNNKIRYTAKIYTPNLTQKQIKIAERSGFMSRSVTEKHKAISDSYKQAVQTRIRLESEYMMKNIGTRVCKKDGRTLYVGFIEGATDKKVKISVAEGQLVGSRGNYSNPNFKPITIWDFPKNWHICE